MPGSLSLSAFARNSPNTPSTATLVCRPFTPPWHSFTLQLKQLQGFWGGGGSLLFIRTPVTDFRTHSNPLGHRNLLGKNPRSNYGDILRFLVDVYWGWTLFDPVHKVISKTEDTKVTIGHLENRKYQRAQLGAGEVTARGQDETPTGPHTPG